jgi:5'-AMP-activated protein kinase catalytic alpha subunit
MVCGYLPFEDPNTGQLYKKILSANYQIPNFVSAECKDLIKKLLDTDPRTRITISEIRDHPWYKQVIANEKEGTIVGINTINVRQNIVKFEYRLIIRCWNIWIALGSIWSILRSV